MKVETILKQIAAQHDGMLRPADVVDAARPVKHPLHGRFQWDDSLAASEFRLWQARKLIMSVRVEFLPRNESEPINVRAFVSLTTERGESESEDAPSGYRPIMHVVKREDLRAQMLADALGELQTFREKYATLKELAEVFAAISRVRK